MLSYQYGPTFLKNAFSTLLSQLKAKGGQTQYYVVANNILGECTFILLEEDVFFSLRRGCSISSTVHHHLLFILQATGQ